MRWFARMFKQYVAQITGRKRRLRPVVPVERRSAEDWYSDVDQRREPFLARGGDRDLRFTGKCR